YASGRSLHRSLLARAFAHRHGPQSTCSPSRPAIESLTNFHHGLLSLEATWRRHLRQEPDAVIPHVRIRGGGYEQSSPLLRLCASLSLTTTQSPMRWAPPTHREPN